MNKINEITSSLSLLILSAMIAVVLLAPCTYAENCADCQIGSPNTDLVTQIVRTTFVRISGEPWFSTEKEIDDVIGVPWELNASTQEKLRTLPARIRLQLFTSISTDLARLNRESANAQGQAARDQMLRASEEPINPLMFQLAGSSMHGYMQQMVNLSEEHLTPEELSDLAIYALYQRMNLKHDKETWINIKRMMIHHDVWVGLGILLALSYFDNASASVFYPLKRSQYMVAGAFMSYSDFGFELHPIQKLGLSLRGSQGTEVLVADRRQLNPEYNLDGTQKIDDQWVLTLRQHWLAEFIKKFKTEIATRVEYSYAPKVEKNSFSLNQYFNKENVVQDHSLNMNYGIDIKGNSSINLGLYNQRTGDIVGLYAVEETKKIGFFIGLSIDQAKKK